MTIALRRGNETICGLVDFGLRMIPTPRKLCLGVEADVVPVPD